LLVGYRERTCLSFLFHSYSNPDTIYDLFKKGELPGRKVGRQWLTTRTAVLRWIEHSAEEMALTAMCAGQGGRRGS
jgi:excisionase family DNA binding protein